MEKHSKYYKRNFISIAIAGAGAQAMYVFMQNYASFFFTEFLGISAGVAGVIFMVSRAWDAINDPMCGVLIEKVNPRWGKIPTFMIIGGIITAIGLVLLFTVPDMGTGGRTAWGVIFYNVVGMAFTMVTVATMLQLPRGTDRPDEMVTLNMAYSVACSIVGIAVAALISKGLTSFGADNPARGYQMVALICAVCGLVFLAGGAVLFRDQSSEKVRELGVKEESPKALDMIKAVLYTPSFLIMVIAPCVSNLGFGMSQANLMYYLTYNVGNPGMMGMLLSGVYIGLLGGSLFAGYFNKLNKKRMLQVGLLVMSLGAVAWMLFGQSSPLAAAVFYGVSCFGSGMMGTYLSPCLVDCADYAEYKTGVKCQALSLTGFTLVSKMSMGLGTALLSFFLQLGGYVEGGVAQSAEALDMIHTMAFWPMIITGVLGAILMMPYKLDDETMAKARSANNARMKEETSGEAK